MLVLAKHATSGIVMNWPQTRYDTLQPEQEQEGPVQPPARGREISSCKT